jgi:hypothetical protein
VSVLALLAVLGALFLEGCRAVAGAVRWLSRRRRTHTTTDDGRESEWNAWL